MGEFKAVGEPQLTQLPELNRSITGERRSIRHARAIAGRHCCRDGCSAGGRAIAGRGAESGPLHIADTDIGGVRN